MPWCAGQSARRGMHSRRSQQHNVRQWNACTPFAKNRFNKAPSFVVFVVEPSAQQSAKPFLAEQTCQLACASARSVDWCACVSAMQDQSTVPDVAAADPLNRLLNQMQRNEDGEDRTAQTARASWDNVCSSCSLRPLRVGSHPISSSVSLCRLSVH